MTARSTFRPHQRVRRPEDFKRAFDRRRSASDELIVVHAAENGLDHARLGISVGRKRIRKSTDRNRVKRLIREVFRLNMEAWPVGVDLIVVPRGIKGLTFDRLRASLPELARSAAARLRKRPPDPSK